MPTASSVERDLLPPMPPHVASEFLLFLIFREANGNNEYDITPDLNASVEVCEEVELKTPEEEKPSVTLRSLATSAHPELLASLRAGRVLHRARLRILTGDREYRLVLTGPQLRWSGVKLPKLIRTGEIATVLHEELFLYEELHRIVTGLFALYAKRRVSADRWAQEGNSIRTWLGETFSRVFSFEPAN